MGYVVICYNVRPQRTILVKGIGGEYEKRAMYTDCVELFGVSYHATAEDAINAFNESSWNEDMVRQRIMSIEDFENSRYSRDLRDSYIQDE